MIELNIQHYAYLNIHELIDEQLEMALNLEDYTILQKLAFCLDQSGLLILQFYFPQRIFLRFLCYRIVIIFTRFPMKTFNPITLGALPHTIEFK